MKIMVISPHPDDETLGAGGSLLKLSNLGNEIYWMNVTDAGMGEHYSADFVKKRRIQINRIKQHYVFDRFINLRFPPAELNDGIKGELINSMGRVFDEMKPECLILPDYNDAHSDHRYVFEAAYACSKIFRRSFIRRILTMEIISETNDTNRSSFELSAITHTMNASLLSDNLLCVCVPSLRWGRPCASSRSVLIS